MSPKRGYWFLFTGLVLGLGLGLLTAWVFAPVQYTDTTPASLRADFKDEYRAMIASAYSATGNLQRAQARLANLGDVDPLKALGEQAQRMMANNAPMEMTQRLADLSEALQAQAAAVPGPTVGQNSPTPATPSNLANATPGDQPTPSATPSGPVSATSAPENLPSPEATSVSLPSPVFTFAPRPTRTSTPTPDKPFELANQSTFCETSQPGLLQVNISNNANQPAAGIELIITWFGGEEHFFTGLKPELGNGYADFVMTDKVEYALSLSAGGTRITGLTAPLCIDAGGSAYSGGIRLEFKQP